MGAAEALVSLDLARQRDLERWIAWIRVGAFGFAIYGVAPTGWMFCLGVPVMALWGLATPTAAGIMSRQVSPSEQGQLQGANASIQSIANLIGPGIFALLFAYAIGAGRDWNVPGAPYLLAAVLPKRKADLGQTAREQRSADLEPTRGLAGGGQPVLDQAVVGELEEFLEAFES